MMFLTMTAAQLLVYMTSVCPSKVEVLPEQNMTVVYKCIANPLLPAPKYPKMRDKDQSRVEPTRSVSAPQPENGD